MAFGRSSSLARSGPPLPSHTFDRFDQIALTAAGAGGGNPPSWLRVHPCWLCSSRGWHSVPGRDLRHRRGACLDSRRHRHHDVGCHDSGEPRAHGPTTDRNHCRAGFVVAREPFCSSQPPPGCSLLSVLPLCSAPAGTPPNDGGALSGYPRGSFGPAAMLSAFRANWPQPAFDPCQLPSRWVLQI